MKNLQSQGASLDQCQQCGAIWLDGGEFARVVDYYTGPLHARSASQRFSVLDGLELLEPLEPVGDVVLVLFEIFGDISGLS